MRRQGTIVTYTAAEIDEMLARGEDKTDWERVRNMTEEELEASIDYEEEGYPDWSKVTIGIPGPKKQVTLRLDPFVLNFFKKEGRGYQTRMNAVLRHYVEEMNKREAS